MYSFINSDEPGIFLLGREPYDRISRTPKELVLQKFKKNEVNDEKNLILTPEVIKYLKIPKVETEVRYFFRNLEQEEQFEKLLSEGLILRVHNDKKVSLFNDLKGVTVISNCELSEDQDMKERDCFRLRKVSMNGENHRDTIVVSKELANIALSSVHFKTLPIVLRKGSFIRNKSLKETLTVIEDLPLLLAREYIYLEKYSFWMTNPFDERKRLSNIDSGVSSEISFNS